MTRSKSKKAKVENEGNEIKVDIDKESVHIQIKKLPPKSSSGAEKESVSLLWRRYALELIAGLLSAVLGGVILYVIVNLLT